MRVNLSHDHQALLKHSVAVCFCQGLAADHFQVANNATKHHFRQCLVAWVEWDQTRTTKECPGELMVVDPPTDHTDCFCVFGPKGQEEFMRCGVSWKFLLGLVGM